MRKESATAALRPLEAWEIDLVAGGRAAANDDAIVYIGGGSDWDDGSIDSESLNSSASGGYGTGGYGSDPYRVENEYGEYIDVNGNWESSSLSITAGNPSGSFTFDLKNFQPSGFELSINTSQGHFSVFADMSGGAGASYSHDFGGGRSLSFSVSSTGSGWLGSLSFNF